MGREALLGLMAGVERHAEPPKWVYDSAERGMCGEGLDWLTFKDLDGEPCTALVDNEHSVVVTLMKRGL